MKVKMLYEGICGNKKALGLVSLMKPVDLMRALVKVVDIHPKDAARVVFGLRKKAEGLTGGSIETNKEFPVPAKLRSDDESEEEMDETASLARGSGTVWGGPRPDAINRRHFPPDPTEKELEFPYGDTFKNYMNNPKRKKPLTSGKGPQIKHKSPLDIDLRSDQPGGAGSGIYRRTMHSQDNSTPGGGSSWASKGASPGWAGSPKGQEFDPFQRRVAKSKNKEEKISNAGDDDDEPSIFKQPNTGGTIWVPATGRSGTSNQPGRKGFRKR